MAILVQSNKKPSVTFPSLTGSIVTFNSQYAGLPLKSHKIALTATQSGSGTPSPDNVRPISGYSAIGVAHSNRNILPYTLEDIINANGGQSTWTDNQKTINGMTFTLNTDSDGKLTSITVKNTATYNTAFYLHSRFTSIYFPASTLYSGVSSAVSGYSARISHSGGQIISSTTAEVAKKTYSNCDIILFFNSGNTFDITISPRLILSGESDNSYVPHEGKYTTIQIGSTVYGGEYDARTGVLTIIHAFVTYDSNNVPFMQIATISGGVKTRIFIRQSGVSQDISGVPDMLCNIAEPVEVNAQYTGDEGISIRVNANVNNQGFYIYNEDLQTLTDWQDYINNNSISVVYPLATPETIQLPPCPIDTLQGENNLFASTGETTASHIKIGG